MKCVYCGHDLPDSAVFCSNCGTPVRTEGQAGTNEEASESDSMSADGSGTMAGNLAPDAGTAMDSSGPSKKREWKDQYTIGIIVGLCVIAGLIGFAVKSARNSSTQEADIIEASTQTAENDSYDEVIEEEEAVSGFEEEEEKEEEGKKEKEEEKEKEKEVLESEETPEADGYVIPDSDSKYLTDADINGLDIQQVNYAKNEIYARHGRKFQSNELQTYFNSKSWYNGTVEPAAFNEGVLNDYERKNAEKLSRREFSMESGGYKLDQ